jgi:hypothetical protein
MALIFHTIWLGGCPPLRALDHLAHLMTLSADDGSVPLLWLDRSAWGALLRQAPLPVEACAAAQIPAALTQRTAALLGQPSAPIHWLHLDHPIHGAQQLPVLLLEELGEDLAEPWRDLGPALERLREVGESKAGRAFLVEELALEDPATACLLEGPTLLAYLQTLIDHGRRQWGAHGLLCLPSDLLRLLALSWRPGAYGDLGDVAGRLPRLPVARDAGPGGFCAHHTVAIENDLIVGTDRLYLQALTLATALWSWRRVRAIAGRLGIQPPSDNPVALLRAVLPHLDQRLPHPPELALLLQPPWTLLADFINLAYGAPPLFHPAESLAAYSAGHRGKELLINDIGGFTGYQKAAYHLAPGNDATWARCSQRLGLGDYAPQLGWKTYGFGVIDRLVDLGQREPSAAARAELMLMAGSLRMTPAQLEPVARLCGRLHTLLERVEHQPEQRLHWLAQVEKLCANPEEPQDEGRSPNSC